MPGTDDQPVPAADPPRLVGREAERNRLRQALAGAAAGAGQGVLVSGQPGVGKSALLAAVRADARTAGYLVVSGRGHQAERGLGYGPVIEAFGSDLGRLGVRRARALVHGLPVLGRLFTGVPGKLDPLGDPPVERLRLVDALARLCERVVAGTPMLLILDDLHWTDSSTLQLVHHLLRRLEGDRFLLVAAARTAAEDDPATADYAEFLASTRRLGLLDEIAVGQLAPDDTASLLEQLLPGARPGAELVDHVHRRSGGLPLFVVALARSMTTTQSLLVLDGEWTPAPWSAEGGPLPMALRSVLTDQLSRLQPGDRAVLDLLAVHAAPLPHAELLAAAGRREPDLLGALRRLAAAGATCEEEHNGAVSYTVSHALLGEAASDQLPAVSRQRLHLALSDAVAAAPRPAVDAVARHLRGAGDLVAPPRRIAALLAAADTARTRGDYAAAAEALGQAVALAPHDRTGPSDADGSAREVRLRWAETLHRAGRAAEAIEVWQGCLTAEHDSATRSGDARAGRRTAALYRQLAAAEVDCGRLDAAAVHLDEAVAAARRGCLADEPGIEPAELDSIESLPTMLGGALADRFALAERCEDLATAGAAAAELDDLATRTAIPAVTVEAALTRAGLARARFDIGAAQRAGADAITAARSAGSAVLELRALATVLEVAIEAGDARAIRSHADQALVLARRLGAPASELRAIGCRAAAGLLEGDWPACDRDLARALALSRRFDVPRSLATVLTMRGLLETFRGDLAAAESAIGQAQRYAQQVAQDRHVAGDLAVASCRLAVARGDRDKVAGLVDALRRRGGRNVALRLITAAQALAFLGRHDEITALTERLAAGYPNPYCTAMADWAAGLADGGHPGSPVAAARLRSAVDGLDGLGKPYWAALGRLDLAESARPPGAPAGDAGPASAGEDDAVAAARSRAEHALETFERLGARRDADRARRLLRGLGARPRPVRRPGVAGGPLSARELEIARLFAEGLTTAEVAARLVLSPHTVTAHLRRIYTRLEVHSRASLTRILAEQGLLSPDQRPPAAGPD